jgi:hypothetical protein
MYVYEDRDMGQYNSLDLPSYNIEASCRFECCMKRDGEEFSVKAILDRAPARLLLCAAFGVEPRQRGLDAA